MKVGITYTLKTKGVPMRFEDLALRLDALMKKVAALQGISTEGWAPPAPTLEKLEARLTATEYTVDYLVSVKTQENIIAIVAAPADAAPVTVESVVALSASADVPEAASIVANVVQAQVQADPVDDFYVEMITSAIQAIIHAEPEVVTDPVAITAVILEAVTETPTPYSPEEIEQAAAAVAEVIAIVTGEAVTLEVHEEIATAILATTDPVLDDIENRLNVAESKVDSLLGK
jgi:hypothetical protein